DRLPGPRPFDFGYVDPRHAHHCVHGALRRRLVGVSEGVEERARDDLPGQPELVLAPATLRFLATISDDCIPVAIGLILAVGIDLKTDRLSELEMRAAVKANEWHAQHSELDGE